MIPAILVDTHVLLWWLADDRRLSERARELIESPGVRVIVSAASIWEIAIKSALGRLQAPDDLPSIIVDEGFEMLAIDAAHAWRVSSVARRPEHQDPFDRLLVAQAAVENLAVLSADRALDGYGIERLWGPS